MTFLRTALITFLLIILIGSLNYFFYDKLSYYFLAAVSFFVLLLMSYGDKLCLNYFKATELTLVEDRDITDFVKSVSFINASKIPELYQFESQTKAAIVLQSLFGWNLLLSKNLLQKLSRDQKFLLIKEVYKIKKDHSFFLRTYGVTIQVLILNFLKMKIFSYPPLRSALIFFFNPLLNLVNKLSFTKFNSKVSYLLDEIIIENKENFESVNNNFKLISLLKSSDIEFERFLDHDLFLSSVTREVS